VESSLVFSLATLCAVILLGSCLPCLLIWRLARQAQINARAAQTGMLALARERPAANRLAFLEQARDEASTDPERRPKIRAAQ
jgi:hypothetical protein